MSQPTWRDLLNRDCYECGCPDECHPYSEWDRGGRLKCSKPDCKCTGYQWDYPSALERLLDQFLDICRGCGRPFTRRPGAAGEYCTRKCYENKARPNRKRATRGS